MDLKIVEYTPKYREAFRNMNVEWISKYFKMEESDYKALDHPDEYIIDKGGAILIVLCDDEPAGVCALIKMDHEVYDFELAKMAVSPKFHGNGIGYKLGLAIIEKAKSMGGKKLYLESNTVLGPAIHLYYKLGFSKVEGVHSPYERCNIQMEFDL